MISSLRVLTEHLEHVDLGPGLLVGGQQPDGRPEALAGRGAEPGLDRAVGERELGLPSCRAGPVVTMPERKS